jgi:hypothetical protein
MSEEKSPLLNSAGAGGDGGKGNSKAAKVDVERLPGYDAHFGAVPKRRTYYFFSNVKWCAPPPSAFLPFCQTCPPVCSVVFFGVPAIGRD